MLAAAAAVLWAVAPSSPASAQAVFGSITGIVTDPSGAAVANAAVTIIDTAKGTQTVVRTSGNGEYSAQHLIPDVYTVQVDAPGFSRAQTANVQVFADTAPRVDLPLVPAGSTSNVTVTGAPPILETDRADVATILNARALENLPNFNRNFTAFELLTPGTTYIGWNVGESNNPQRSQQIEVNGQLPFATGYELDGTDNQDPIIGVAVINPDLDAVSEMKVTSQNYDAEFGKAVAGLVTAQTKSGSNAFHGSAFEFRRSDAQQARDPFAQSTPNALTGRYIPANLHNQFGGSVGGPVKKDKIFFFGDYQGLREKTGSSVLTTVPTALALTSCTSGGDCNLSDYLQAGQGQVYDPATNQTATTGRTPFAGNIIPAGRLDPAAVNFFKLLPKPNVGAAGAIVNNYQASGSGVFNNDQFNVRGDGQLSTKTHVFGRYTRFNSSLIGPAYFGAAGGPGFGAGSFSGTDSSLYQSVAAGADYLVSQSWLTDFRFGWFRIHLNEEGPNYDQPLGNQLGIPNTNVGDLALNGGLPQFNITIPSNGSNGSSNIEYGTSANQFLQNESRFQIVNNWSHTLGDHNIRFGGDVRYALNHLVGLDNNNVRSGNFGFTETRTAGTDVAGVTSAGVGFASFILGDASSFTRTQTQNTNAQERQKLAFFYVQDQWRVSPKLTLNYGIRYEFYFPETVNGKGQGGLLDFATGDIRIAGYGPWGTNLNVVKSYTNLAPRFGLTYQANPKTVFRAGYGRVYGQGWSGNTFGETLTFSYPTQVSQNLNAVTNAAAVFNLAQGPPSFTFAPIPASGSYPLPDGVGVPTRPTYVRLPTLDAWNAAVQQQLTSTLSLQIGYVASHAVHNMFDSSNQASNNQPTLAGFNAINPLTNTAYTKNDRRPFYNGIAQQLGVGYGTPYGWTQDFRYNANQATSSYQALQVVLEKHFSNGLQFLSHYTWSHALAHESDYFFIDSKADYGNSYYNRRNVFLFTSNYELPFGQDRMFGSNLPGWLRQTVGGFAINGTLAVEGGLPFTPTYLDCAQDEDIDGTGGSLCRPSKTGVSPQVGSGSFNAQALKVPYFKTSPVALTNGNSYGAFARPAVGTFGNYGRDSLWGPGLINTDFSVAKTFNITEKLNLQFRAEGFNVFNHPNLGQPDGCVDCQDGNAGTISSTVSSQDGTSMRRLQFAARVQF